MFMSNKRKPFKVLGFTVSYREQRDTYFIYLSRTVRRSLKTNDRKKAEKIAFKVAKGYLDNKIVEFERKNKIFLSEYLKDFLADKDFDSHHTINAYVGAINYFIEFVGDKSINLYTSEDVRTYKRLHRARRLDNKKKGIQTSKISINSYLKHIRAVFRKAREDGYTQSVPKFEFFKVAKNPPTIMSEDDKQRLLEYMKENDYEFYRISQFALFTGCRRAEILSARWENFNGISIQVTGKGSKMRTVPLVPMAKQVMGKPQKSGPIFWQVHPDTYTKRFKTLLRACGNIDDSISFHKMRHTAATTMLGAGVPIHIVQAILGHTDIATTKIYAQTLDEHVIKAMENFGRLPGDSNAHQNAHQNVENIDKWR